MILFGDYHQLALDFDRTTLAVRPDNLEAFDIADARAGPGLLRQDHRDAARLSAATSGASSACRRSQASGATTYSPYDWRQDNVETARALDRLIEAIRRDYGDPTLRVDIVAHSMGGLVARYYQRYGTADVLDGRESQVTLYGTSPACAS